MVIVCCSANQFYVTALRDEKIDCQANTQLPQLLPQPRAGLDAAMEVGQAELLVGTVRVVVVLAPAQQQDVGVQGLVEPGDDGDRAAFAGVDRRRPKACSMARAAAAT